MSRQVAGLALHALEPDEEFAVRRHLRGCPDCTDALRAHHEIAALVGAAVPSQAPPPGLRSRILAAATTATATTTSTSTATATLEQPAPASPQRGRHSLDRAPDRPGRPRRPRRRLVAALVAAACAIAVGGLAGQAASMRSQRDAEVAQAHDLGRIVTGLDAPGNAHAILADAAGTAVAAVVTGPDELRVVATDLPTNDPTSVYVLWATDSGAPRALGTFDAHAGRADVVALPEAAGARAFAVSLEPGRTAPATPTTVVASGRIEV